MLILIPIRRATLRNNEVNEPRRCLGSQERLAFIKTTSDAGDRNRSLTSFRKTRDVLGSCHQNVCEEGRVEDASLTWTFPSSSSASLFPRHLLSRGPASLRSSGRGSAGLLSGEEKGPSPPCPRAEIPGKGSDWPGVGHTPVSKPITAGRGRDVRMGSPVRNGVWRKGRTGVRKGGRLGET